MILLGKPVPTMSFNPFFFSLFLYTFIGKNIIQSSFEWVFARVSTWMVLRANFSGKFLERERSSLNSKKQIQRQFDN